MSANLLAALRGAYAHLDELDRQLRALCDTGVLLADSEIQKMRAYVSAKDNLISAVLSLREVEEFLQADSVSGAASP